MTMKKYIIPFLFLAPMMLQAQDFHLSQYDASHLYINPAATGMYNGQKNDYRIFSDYRSQWRALGIKPYTTAYISYDMPIQKYEGKVGAGGYMLSNSSVQGQFRTIQAAGSVAYNVISGSPDHYLTTGLQMGLLYRSIDYNSYTFDVQYNSATGDFDQSASNQENFSQNSFVRFDAALGVWYKYISQSSKYHPFAGFSVYHLTKPNESFTGTKSRMPMRFVFNTGCDIKINDDFSVTPKFLYMNQAKAYEINAGVLLFYKIKNSSLDVMAGADYRHKDAIVLHIGFRQEQSMFRFSYDINNSGLNAYTGGKGAWEFSLLLYGKKDQPLFKPLF
ncbi:MAG: hypothetical protein Fur0041_21100 [Bacteroidia bacterium]